MTSDYNIIQLIPCATEMHAWNPTWKQHDIP